MDEQSAPIPPRGPQLGLRPWAQLATAYVRRYLPAVKSAGRGDSVVWQLSPRRAVLEALGDTWFVTFEQDGRRTGAGLSIERHDAFI
jgi:hypothetical protein